MLTVLVYLFLFFSFCPFCHIVTVLFLTYGMGYFLNCRRKLKNITSTLHSPLTPLTLKAPNPITQPYNSKPLNPHPLTPRDLYFRCNGLSCVCRAPSGWPSSEPCPPVQNKTLTWPTAGMRVVVKGGVCQFLSHCHSSSKGLTHQHRLAYLEVSSSGFSQES